MVKLLLLHGKIRMAPTHGLLPPGKPGWVDKWSCKSYYIPVCSSRSLVVCEVPSWLEGAETAKIHCILLGYAVDNVLPLEPVR